MIETSRHREGSSGERELQERFGTTKRAAAFYGMQMLDHLNDLMRDFIAAQAMMFIATADRDGNCDASLRAGPRGFVRVVDEKTLLYPEYRGNGVMASLGNISENAHVGLLFLDFEGTRVGLHVNGAAKIVDRDAVSQVDGELAALPFVNGLGASVLERWVSVSVHEAYIHCSKHIPRFQAIDAERRAVLRGTEVTDGDFFRVRRNALGSIPALTPAR